MKSTTTTFLLLLLTVTVSSLNFSLSVTDDSRRVMDLGVFGFSDNGVMEFVIEELSMLNTTDAQMEEPLGFTLDWVTTAHYARQEKNYGKGEAAQQKICFIKDTVVQPQNPGVIQWRQLFPLESELKQGKVRKTIIHQVKEAGLYALFFYNCKGYDIKSELQSRPVSFKVKFSQYNVRPGGVIEYLSEGNRKMPLMYAMFTLIFIVLSVCWIKYLRSHMMHVHKIHFLMSMLIILKTCSLFFEAMKLETLLQEGASTGWKIMSYLFLTLKGITLFLVIMLLGTGWSFLKPFLSKNDKHIALAILPLQVLINIAIAVLEETSEGNRSWTYWRDILRLSDFICCIVVLFPIIWSIEKLHKLGSIEGKVAKNLARLKQFRAFYLFVVGFMYLTRIFVVLLDSYIPFRLTWAAPFVQVCKLLVDFECCEKNGEKKMMEKKTGIGCCDVLPHHWS